MHKEENIEGIHHEVPYGFTYMTMEDMRKWDGTPIFPCIYCKVEC